MVLGAILFLLTVSSVLTQLVLYIQNEKYIAEKEVNDLGENEWTDDDAVQEQTETDPSTGLSVRKLSESTEVSTESTVSPLRYQLTKISDILSAPVTRLRNKSARPNYPFSMNP